MISNNKFSWSAGKNKSSQKVVENMLMILYLIESLNAQSYEDTMKRCDEKRPHDNMNKDEGGHCYSLSVISSCTKCRILKYGLSYPCSKSKHNFQDNWSISVIFLFFNFYKHSSEIRRGKTLDFPYLFFCYWSSNQILLDQLGQNYWNGNSCWVLGTAFVTRI